MRLRLTVLEEGHPWPKRVLIRFVEVVGRVRADDVARTSLYRPIFFGRAWLRFARSLLRGASDWTPAERELMAAFISRRNECPYCVGVHTATASLGLGRQVDARLLDDWRIADLDPRMRAAFELLEKRAHDPIDLTADDVDHARAAGLTDGAIYDALSLGFMFDLVNRLANVFGYTTVDEAGRIRTAAILHRIGYRVPGVLLR